MGFLKKIINWLLNAILVVSIVVSIWIFSQVFLLASFRIPSDSMEPELVEGDFVAVWKPTLGARLFDLNATLRLEQTEIHRTPGFRKAKRGDVLVFNFPHPNGWDKIEMHILPDVYVPCEVCGGRRYNRETLEVRYKGKTIYDVLDMTVEEALEFFKNVPTIHRKIQTLYDVGLSYVKLGQPSTELSGGEAQRIKLATELSKRGTGKTIYVLDEPTTGLHFADVHKLVEILRKLSDGGNTVVVIEHNLDVIKTADYIIDMGPEGGDGGGTVIAQGTPEEICKVPESYTGQFLKPYLESKNV